MNFTKGNLVSTAYRTRKTDNWSFKYYRYDERGRVIRMWNTIDGLGNKNITYHQYNSQDQIVQLNYGYETEYKRYSYYYDFGGRLGIVNYANAEPSLDKSAADINFTNYTYNPNSLIDFQFFNSYQLQNQYNYDSRNWIISMNNIEGLFGFTNTYYKNGNLNTQLLFGTYKDYYPQNNYNLNYYFSYDNSNRLLNAINTNSGDLTYSVLNTYDKDGNLTTLKRYGDNNTLTDDFNYVYTSGTNKLIRVSGSVDQFNSDLNGNTILDDLNSNYNIKYDHRNLITELYHKAVEGRAYVYATRYYYDESGNRVRKLVYLNSQTDPPLITDWNNPGGNWQLSTNEFYVKGVDGKDLATYQGNILDEWFVWGNDLTGKIKGDKRYFYYKDHLGSVRVVVDNTNSIVAGYDYDAWGYPLENRNYNGDSIKFKYTGKELDKESLYDYFGARYYDARIGRWGQVEPMLEKYFSFSPYSYAVLNPQVFRDVNGKDAIAEVDEKNKRINITFIFNYSRFNKENQRGINAAQYNVLLEFQQNIQELWSGNFEINGVDYEVSTTVQLIAFGNFGDAIKATQENTGQNIVLNAQVNDIIEGDIGVGSDASVLFLRKGKYLNPKWDTGAHEAGHLLGLPDITSMGNNSIMSYALDRYTPSSSEFNEIIGRSNLNLSITGPQVIGGFQR